ncbi:hypothetical protein VP01_77g6 [Puccinia sorghi]|uniref:Uncharacterized protein n=1 Tax=Puccinia sorghi TaxID=27349 RepID=A0A0L6UC12_9BASI|nr:hypothetical protein VP01_77g6 [Puccinia sorghi]
MKTHQYPQGQFVHVKLLCLLGDLLSTKKRFGGFASPITTCYCTLCLSQCQALQKVKLGLPHKREETISAAKNSKTSASADAQDTILKNTGVQWSELNRLNYWDPSQKIALGIMHNWLEGVLQSNWKYQRCSLATSPRKTQKQSQPIQQLCENKQQCHTIHTPTLMDIEDSKESSNEDEKEEDDIMLNVKTWGRISWKIESVLVVLSICLCHTLGCAAKSPFLTSYSTKNTNMGSFSRGGRLCQQEADWILAKSQD